MVFAAMCLQGCFGEPEKTLGQQQAGVGPNAASQAKSFGLSKVSIKAKDVLIATIGNFVFNAQGLLKSVEYEDHAYGSLFTKYEFEYLPDKTFQSVTESYPNKADSGKLQTQFAFDQHGHVAAELHIEMKLLDPPMELYELDYKYSSGFAKRTGTHSNEPSINDELTFNADALPLSYKKCGPECMSIEFSYDNKILKGYKRQFMDTITADITTDATGKWGIILKNAAAGASAYQIKGTYDGDKLIQEEIMECPDEKPCTNAIETRIYEYKEMDVPPVIPPRRFLLPMVTDSLLYIDNNVFLFGKDGQGMDSWFD